MRAEYLKLDTPGEDSGSNPLNTGDAIRAGMAIGAKTDLTDAVWWSPCYRFEGEDRSYPMFMERALPGSIIVNGAGRRYMNEAASYHSNGGRMVKLAANGEPTIPGLYAIGNTSASVMGRIYPGAGATIGPAMTFGWLAARHAMGAND